MLNEQYPKNSQCPMTNAMTGFIWSFSFEHSLGIAHWPLVISKSLLNHELYKVGDAATVTPLVIVPGNELEEPFIEFDARAFIVDRRCFGMDEIGADDFFVSGFEDAFQITLAGLLHCGRNFCIACF